ncbi:MAG: chemotaxis protein CheB [Trichormus sp.]
MSFEIVVIGASLGGLSALEIILGDLPPDFPLPIVIVQHRHKDSAKSLKALVQTYTLLPVKEVEDKDEIIPGQIYLAPADYHVLVERGYFDLSTDVLVSYVRPSIDVLFESAADIYAEGVIGLILTGANEDGTQGLKKIKARGGITIVEDPSTAHSPIMPAAAISDVVVDWILPLPKISHLLINLCYSTGN